VSKEVLTLKKGGKLIQTRWVYDDLAKEGEYKDFDVTNKAISYIREACELEEGVTLKDLFLLLQPEVDLFQVIFQNWLKEYVEYGLNNPGKPAGTYDPEEIEYLELYWDLYFDSEALYGHSRPSFHGVGYELRENLYWKQDGSEELGEPQWQQGERIPWGLMGSDLLSFINKPLKLNNKLTIYDDNLDGDPSTYGKVLAEYSNPTYTLFNIIEGVFWEISFHGGISESKEFSEELKEAADKVRSGEAKTVPFDPKDLDE
jgi:hypothetical protein